MTFWWVFYLVFNFSTNIMIDPLAKPAMLGFASNLQFFVNSGSKLIINYLILTRFSGQNVDYIFSVMPMGVLMTNVITHIYSIFKFILFFSILTLL